MHWEHAGPLGPIVTSILAVIMWLVFIVIYALYWSTRFSLFQNIVVTLASLAIMGLVIGLAWVVWGMTRWRHWMNMKLQSTLLNMVLRRIGRDYGDITHSDVRTM